MSVPDSRQPTRFAGCTHQEGGDLMRDRARRLTLSAAALTSGRPAVSIDCFDYEDWEEVDIGPNDPYHQTEGQIHPEEQQPSGEWEFVQEVASRQGNNHAILEEFTVDSGEHIGCFF
jgi:hypothetical protein